MITFFFLFFSGMKPLSANNNDDDDYVKLCDKVMGKKYVLIKETSKNEKYIDIEVNSKNANNNIIVLISNTIKQSISKKESIVKGGDFVEENKEDAILLEKGKTLKITIPRSLVDNCETYLFGFIKETECSNIYFSTKREEFIETEAKQSICIYHLANNSIATINGREIANMNVDEQREHGITSDGEIIKLHSLTEKYNISLSSNSHDINDGTRMIINQSRKINSKRSVKKYQYDDFHYETIDGVSYYLKNGTSYYVTGTSKYSLYALLTFDILAGIGLYTFLGFMKMMGKSDEFFDDRTNYFYQETIYQYE